MSRNKIIYFLCKNPTGDVIGIGVGNVKTKSEQNAAYNSLITLNVIKDTCNDDNNSDYYGEVSSQQSEKSDNSSDYFE
jgi:hypothetical protein